MNQYIEETKKGLVHTYNRFPVVLERGEGVYLYDTEGKRYLDFAAGIAVCGLGYGNQELNRTLKEQIDALKRRHLPETLRRDLWVMTTTEAEASRARMAEAAEKMAVGADNPGCVLFKDSVALYRAEKARAEAMEQRAAELDALEGEEGGAA